MLQCIICMFVYRTNFSLLFFSEFKVSVAIRGFCIPRFYIKQYTGCDKVKSFLAEYHI